jgi:hypothetical protein
VTTAAVGNARPQLHLPDEPIHRKQDWWSAICDGRTLDDVLPEAEEWFWSRWRIVEGAGIDRAAFGTVVAGYRRELWLWLAGERTWEQCCSGLVGRISRRYPA